MHVFLASEVSSSVGVVSERVAALVCGRSSGQAFSPRGHMDRLGFGGFFQRARRPACTTAGQQSPQAGEVLHFCTWAASGSEHTLNLYGVYPVTEA